MWSFFAARFSNISHALDRVSFGRLESVHAPRVSRRNAGRSAERPPRQGARLRRAPGWRGKDREHRKTENAQSGIALHHAVPPWPPTTTVVEEGFGPRLPIHLKIFYHRQLRT